jgi:alpha-tubulin suppressor-like RCC1 family protein
MVFGALGGTLACGGGGSSSNPIPLPVISGFTATPSLLSLGASSTLTATFSGGQGVVDPAVGSVVSGQTIAVSPAQDTTYALTVSIAGGSSVSRSVTVRVVPVPSQPVISAPGAVTALGTGYVASVPGQSGCTYAWTITGGTIVSGADTPQIVFTAGEAGSLALNCVVSNAAGLASAPGSAAVTVAPVPQPPTLTVAALATHGVAFTASASPQAGCTQQWSMTGGTIVTGQGTTSVTCRPEVIGPLTLKVTATNAAGAVSAPGVAQITAVAMPAISVFSPSRAIISTGDSADFSFTFNGVAASVQPGNLTVVNGGKLTVHPAATTRYTLTVLNQAGASISQEQVITVVAPPAITGFTTPGGVVNAAQGSSFLATFSGGTGVVNPGGYAIVSGTPLPILPPATTLFELTVTNAAGLSVKAKTAVTIGAPVASGMESACILKQDGTVWVWGMGCGPSSSWAPNGSWSSPAKLEGVAGMVSVALGYSQPLVLKGDGTVWSLDASGLQPPAQVPGLAGVVSLSAGGAHNLALGADGTVWAWGSNDLGQLGDGSTVFRPKAIQVAGLAGVVAVQAGIGQSLALKADGSVWAWGSNASGLLGDGTHNDRSLPSQIMGLADVAALAITTGNGLALKADGTLWIWGDLQIHAVAPSVPNPSLPSPIQGPAEVIGLSGGLTHVAFTTRGGTVWTMGSNFAVQLGSDENFFEMQPRQVPGLTGILGVSAGGLQNFALKNDGTLWSWGDNMFGQLGDGMPVARPAPSAVTFPVPLAFMGGSQDTALVVKPDGTLWGWGSNQSGQLNIATTLHNNGFSSPQQVPGLSGVLSAAGGRHASFALKTDGTVWSWGHNVGGVLGNGTFDSPAPMDARPVPGLAGVVAITAGAYHCLALKADGTVWGWGGNASGVLGDGSTEARATPVQAGGTTAITAIASSISHNLAIQGGGAIPGLVWAWGNNLAGALGDGTTDARTAPIQVPGLSNVVAVAAGSDFSLALKDDGTVWAWGSMPGFRALSPVPVAGLSGIVAIAAGTAHGMALKSDGTVWTLGYNFFGQLGRLAPIEDGKAAVVPGLAGVTAIHAGSYCSFATGPGFLVSWGADTYGTLGLNRPLQRSVPAVIAGAALW